MADEPPADLGSIAKEVHSVKGLVENLHKRQSRADEIMTVMQGTQAELAKEHQNLSSKQIALDRRLDGVSNHVTLVDRLQAAQNARNDEIHQDMRAETHQLRAFLEKAIGEFQDWRDNFRKEFLAHTEAEDNDRRSTINWLRTTFVAVVLGGAGIVVTLLSSGATG